MATSSQIKDPGARFAEQAEIAFGDLSTAFRGLLGSLPGEVHRAVDLERALRLDKRLAWQVFKVANSLSLSEMVHIPAKSSIERLTEAAAKKRVRREVLDRISSSFEGFECFVRDHAGDRATLLSMVHGQSPSPDEQFEQDIREAHFRAQTHTWGMRMGGLIRTTILLPSVARPDAFDEIVISTVLGLEQLRNLGHPVHRTWIRRAPKEGEPLSAVEGATPTFQLLDEFCSGPLPSITQRRSEEHGGLEIEIQLSAVGKTGAANLCFAHTIRDSGAESDLPYQINTFVTTPNKFIALDMLVPHGWTDPSTARCVCYGNRYVPMRACEKHPEDLLPPRFAVHVGSGGVREFPEAGRHRDAVLYFFAKHGLDPRSYDSYRTLVAYPTMHILYSMMVNSKNDARPRAEVEGHFHA